MMMVNSNAAAEARGDPFLCFSSPLVMSNIVRSRLLAIPLRCQSSRALFSTAARRLQQEQVPKQPTEPKVTHFGFRNVPEEEKESLGK